MEPDDSRVTKQQLIEMPKEDAMGLIMSRNDVGRGDAELIY